MRNGLYAESANASRVTHHVTHLLLVGLPEYDAGLSVHDDFLVTLAGSLHLDLPDQDPVLTLEVRILDAAIWHLAQSDPASTSFGDPHIGCLDLVLAEDLVGRFVDFCARLVSGLVDFR